MAKRRKRRSTKAIDQTMKEIRRLHREHLQEISAILTNALGFAVKVTPVRAPEVLQIPRAVRKKHKGPVHPKTAHIAGWGDDRHQPGEVETKPLPDDSIGF